MSRPVVKASALQDVRGTCIKQQVGRALTRKGTIEHAPEPHPRLGHVAEQIAKLRRNAAKAVLDARTYVAMYTRITPRHRDVLRNCAHNALERAGELKRAIQSYRDRIAS
jgi:hypothetical protein